MEFFVLKAGSALAQAEGSVTRRVQPVSAMLHCNKYFKLSSVSCNFTSGPNDPLVVANPAFKVRDKTHDSLFVHTVSYRHSRDIRCLHHSEEKLCRKRRTNLFATRLSNW